MKRIVSLVLALAMVLSLCIFTTASADNGFVDGKFTETRHITVEVYNRYNDGGSDPTSSVYAQYIKQGMLDKYNVDVELVSVGRWTEVDDLNNLLATGDAPDVCVTYSYPTIQTFAGMGGIIDLNPLLTEYRICCRICGRCWATTTSTTIRIRKPALCGRLKRCWRNPRASTPSSARTGWTSWV